MTGDGLTIEQTAERYGVHPQTVRKRISAGAFAAATKDQRGRWRLDPAEVEAVTGWTATAPALDRPAGEGLSTGSSSAVALYEQLAPLFQRVSNAEQERADAQVAARVAEHRAEQLRARARAAPWLAVVALAVGLALGALVVAALA